MIDRTHAFKGVACGPWMAPRYARRTVPRIGNISGPKATRYTSGKVASCLQVRAVTLTSIPRI
ncbi:hypothetical protein BLA23254_07958 [Burkholderia lata]|uniref:Uncharacterized protein n=1 Tax=Burkholderia lata (strain ATCC 17760 / DSM 23089 / LMG 22485 / NCIMB 9086 / R18194 / 383) TaxID=482957 RepID=A0A6P2SQP2_BURL3|nr:hypothetical protein BLA23254_07958 [Burkholderia lata]